MMMIPATIIINRELFRIDINDSPLILISVRIWNREGSTSTSVVISSFYSNPLPSTVQRRDLFHVLVHHLFFPTTTDLDTDNATDRDTVPQVVIPTKLYNVSASRLIQ